MNSLFWWITFACLIVLVIVVSLYLCFSVFCGNFRKNKPKNRLAGIDLTRIEKDLRSVSPRFSLVDAFEETGKYLTFDALSKDNFEGSLLPDFHKTNCCNSIDDIMSGLNMETSDRRSNEILLRKFCVVTEGMRKNSLATLPRTFSVKPDTTDRDSIDTLDCLDPIVIEIKRDLATVEKQAQKIAQEIEYFMGTTKNLRYYEIHEKLIRLSLALNDLECVSEELRQMKKDVQGYINECKKKLEGKVVLF